MKQVIIGFATEGTTDVRFLESIIQRSFEDVAFECIGDVEVLPVQYIEKQPGKFVDTVICYAQKAENLGLMVLCIHSDADAPKDSDVFTNKINPAFTAVDAIESIPACKTMVAIVPVQMVEAWMLSDKELLKAEIGTTKSNVELGLHRHPEAYADPKNTIVDAIRIARQEITMRRRNDLSIGELYLPIGQKVAIEQLEHLPSYCKFKDSVRNAFRKLHYLP